MSQNIYKMLRKKMHLTCKKREKDLYIGVALTTHDLMLNQNVCFKYNTLVLEWIYFLRP